MWSASGIMYIKNRSFCSLYQYMMRSLYLTSNASKKLQTYSKTMDLEWLLPQQIEQILHFCELSAVEDLTVAANILEANHWDIEKAMHDVVNQNDHIKQQEQRQAERPQIVVPPQEESEEWSYNNFSSHEEEFQMGPHDYHQLSEAVPNLTKPNPSEHSAILSQQNYEYQEMQRKMLEKQAEEEMLENYKKDREAEFSEGQKEFEDRKVEEPLTIKFRLAHQAAQFTFSKKDKVQTVFKYVNCCLRDGFENRYGAFDLTQSFPPLSLEQRKDKKLEEVFEGSTGELLIVRER